MINVFPLGPGQTIVSTQVRVFLGFAKAISRFKLFHHMSNGTFLLSQT